MAYFIPRIWGAFMAGGAVGGAYMGARYNKACDEDCEFDHSCNRDTLADRTGNAISGGVIGAVALGPLLPFTAIAYIASIGNNNKK